MLLYIYSKVDVCSLVLMDTMPTQLLILVMLVIKGVPFVLVQPVRNVLSVGRQQEELLTTNRWEIILAVLHVQLVS